MSKQEQTRRNWLEVIHLELCNIFKFDYTKKWYVHNQESVLENEMRKKKENLPNSEICRIVKFAVPADHRLKLKESYKTST